jgi:hypothetical protein
MRTHLLTATAGTALLAIPAQAQNATWLVRAKLRSRLMASTAVLLTTVAMIGTAAPAAAQTTWVGGILAPPPATPGSSGWNDAGNWNPAVVPVAPGTAIFNAGTPTSISTLGGASVGTLQFNAPNYTFDVLDNLTISGGSGINASLANSPTFNVIGTGFHSTPAIDFSGGSSAGTAQIILGQVGP